MEKANKITKKQIFNAIELVLQLAVFLILICCKAFDCKNCEFAITFLESPYLVTLISLLFMLINMILCIVSIIKNSPQKDSVWHIVMPILSAITFFLGIIQEPANHTCGASTDLTSYSIFCLFAVTILIFLSFIKKSNFVVSKEPIIVQVTAEDKPSSADELKKYKDLLDSGAITQEEFDAKKKELLGL